ncbi:MAG: histidine kinase [Bacteroidales bacterium]|nr:histidine kinase [Bacteroidales bacterium]
MKSLEHKTNLVFDLFFCLVLMPLLIFLGPARYWWHISPLFTLIGVGYLYACYFATKRLHLPRLILKRAYRKLAAVAALYMGLTYLLTLYPLPQLNFVIPIMTEYQTLLRNYNIAISLWFLFSVVMGYALSVSFIKELYHRKLQQSILENQRNKAELALFKAQINPHFLFNTLNSLYSLVIGTSEKAEDAFVKFTELLKYAYVTADNDWVTIDDELNYLNNYIDLERIRLDEHTQVECDFCIDDPSTAIPPMIFLTFVENAFKYGSSTSRHCRILIRLHVSHGHLLFETRNDIVRHADEFRTAMPVGISNCRSRLAVLFPGRHTISLSEEGGTFHVLLHINLHSHE